MSSFRFHLLGTIRRTCISGTANRPCLADVNRAVKNLKLKSVLCVNSYYPSCLYCEVHCIGLYKCIYYFRDFCRTLYSGTGETVIAWCWLQKPLMETICGTLWTSTSRKCRPHHQQTSMVTLHLHLNIL